MPAKTITQTKTSCYHCGDECSSKRIYEQEKIFCCEGCRMVYGLLNKQGLCDYYALNENPGLSRRIKVREDKFAFLDDEDIQSKLVKFKNETQIHASFYIPQVHCSSCLYLLENLRRLDSGIVSAKLDFAAKELNIVFLEKQTSLRKLAELLAAIGYEPYISLNDLKKKKPGIDKSLVYRLGVAGFCFGNIMLISFPEYLGIDSSETALRNLFRWLNLVLAIPVFLYAAYPFYKSSYKSIRHRFLNIDAPIALAIIITFARSMWEVVSGTGSGYFDSMSGIVFFMLAGRILQDKTYRQLSFNRDYTAYFPVAVSVIRDEKEVPVSLPDIKPGDTLLVHNEELIPADSILSKGRAYIDYSFVTGESAPVIKETGELVYAGGKQIGSNIELLVIKEVAQSYLTALWSRDELKEHHAAEKVSFVHILSRYFTYIVFSIAIITGVYWAIHDPARMWIAVTAVFIVACPCALLLSNTFTNGSILRILARNQFYLRDAQTIENIARVNHIVFDKTGTLTSASQGRVQYKGKILTALQQRQLASLAACSNHPLSRMLAAENKTAVLPVSQYKEFPGKGIEGVVENVLVKIGSSHFITGNINYQKDTVAYVSFDNTTTGWFGFGTHYRNKIPGLIKKLQKRYQLSVLTGDNDAEKNLLSKWFGKKTRFQFRQTPAEKLNYINELQLRGDSVMMIGDGLNDAGALKQADAGIAVSEDNNNFTPACDGIIAASRLPDMHKFMRLCKANRRIVNTSFLISITYNIIGLYFAVQGLLSPLVAAILMPSSSICIVLISFGASNWLAKRMNL